MMVDSTESSDLRHFEDMLLEFSFVLAPVSLLGHTLTRSMHLHGSCFSCTVNCVPSLSAQELLTSPEHLDAGRLGRRSWKSQRSHNEITMSMKNREVEKDLASRHAQTRNGDGTSSITIQSIESLIVFRLSILFAHSQSHNDLEVSWRDHLKSFMAWTANMT